MLISATVAAGVPAAARAQDWSTTGFDAQRSFWLRADSKISASTVREPEFRHLWRVDFASESKLGPVLPAPVLLDFLISHRGFRSLAFLSGADGAVHAFDTDLARLEWRRPLGSGDEPGEKSGECGNGTSAVTRRTSAAYPSMLGVSGFGPARRSPGVGGVGEPGAGALTLSLPRRLQFSLPEPPEPGARHRPPPRWSLFGLSAVFVLSPAGSLHTLLASNGMDHTEPIAFVPPGAEARGLIVVDGVAYVSTAGECDGVRAGVTAVDLASKQLSSWQAEGGTIVGSAGPAMAPDGTIYVATTDGRVVALEAKSLEERASTPAAGRRFATSPVVIDFNGSDYLALTTDRGEVVLLDAGDLAGGPVATTRGYRGPTRFAAGALATWRDAEGATWIAAPVAPELDPSSGLSSNGPVTRGAIAAWRIVTGEGSPAFEGGWISQDLEAPQPPIVVNGVLFATAGGQQDQAALYALDSASGGTLWNDDTSLGNAPQGAYRPEGTKSSSPPLMAACIRSDSRSSISAAGFRSDHASSRMDNQIGTERGAVAHCRPGLSGGGLAQDRGGTRSRRIADCGNGDRR